MLTFKEPSVQGRRHIAYVPGMDDADAAPPAAPKSADIGPLASIAVLATFKSGTPVLIEGDPADHLFRIERGIVKVYRTLSDVRCQITGFLYPGDFLGFAPEDVYLSGAVAVGDVVASRFQRRKVEQLINVSPMVARLLLRRTCHELLAAQEQMVVLGRKTAAERVATFLAQIAQRTASDRLELPMTRTDIADYLGLTIETVSRELGHLREAGILEVRRSRIRILAPDALEARAEGV